MWKITRNTNNLSSKNRIPLNPLVDYHIPYWTEIFRYDTVRMGNVHIHNNHPLSGNRKQLSKCLYLVSMVVVNSYLNYQMVFWTKVPGFWTVLWPFATPVPWQKNAKSKHEVSLTNISNTTTCKNWCTHFTLTCTSGPNSSFFVAKLQLMHGTPKKDGTVQPNQSATATIKIVMKYCSLSSYLFWLLL